MRRFTISSDGVDGDRVTFDPEETRHLARVLRLRPGDTVLAVDDAGRELTVRLERVAETATGTVVGMADGRREPRARVTLLQGIPKGDKMETIVRATTELGVARVLPITTERTVIRLDDAGWRERARRWQRVAREATKQCGRAVVPEVALPQSLGNALAALPRPDGADLRLCLSERDAPPLRGVLDARGASAEIYVIIGPEGGLASREVDAARASGFIAARVGPRVLRTETAGPAVIAILQWHVGDLDAP